MILLQITGLIVYFNTHKTMDEVSEYERIRTENIERNEDFLRSIGLDSKPDMSQSLNKRDPSKRGVTKRKPNMQAVPT